MHKGSLVWSHGHAADWIRRHFDLHVSFSLYDLLLVAVVSGRHARESSHRPFQRRDSGRAYQDRCRPGEGHRQLL
jgi:hypothetical protein